MQRRRQQQTTANNDDEHLASPPHTQPIFAFVFAGILAAFYNPSIDKIKSSTNLYCGVFIAIAVGSFSSSLLQQLTFGTMGQHLALRVRLLMFRSIMRQEVGWFDQEANSSGQLTSRLAEDASTVRGAVGDVLGVMMQNVFCLASGYAIAFAYDWRMALVVTGTLPIMVAGSAIYYANVMGQESGNEKLYSKANQAVSDAFSSIRTIHAYNLNGYVVTLYERMTLGFNRQMIWQSQKTGLLLGYSQFSLFSVYCLIIWFGGIEIRDGRVDFEGMLVRGVAGACARWRGKPTPFVDQHDTYLVLRVCISSSPWLLLIGCAGLRQE